MKNYLVINDKTIEGLEKKVNEKISNGYYIIGQAFSAYLFCTEYEMEKNLICQTMGYREV